MSFISVPEQEKKKNIASTCIVAYSWDYAFKEGMWQPLSGAVLVL